MNTAEKIDLARSLIDAWSFVEGSACERTLVRTLACVADLADAQAQENARLREVVALAEAMLVKIGAALPSSVVQKLPLSLLKQWEAVEDCLRAAEGGAP